MSGPTPVAADTVGNVGIGSPPTIHTADIAGVETYHFKRVYEHYVSNAMDAYGYSEETAGGFADKWMIDEGWQIIPYWNPGCAMSPSDIIMIGAKAAAISVDSLGFTVKQAQLMRQELTPVAGVTTINNSFASQPYFEIFEDERHMFDDIVSVRPNTSTTFPPNTMGYDPLMLPNIAMTCAEVPNFTSGQLKRIVWSNSNVSTPGATWGIDRMVSQVGSGVTNTWSQFSTLNETGRTLMGQDGIQTYGYKWTPKHKDWFPVRMPRTDTDWAGFQGLNTQVPGTIPTRRDYLLNGSAMTSTTNGVNPRGDNLPNCKHNMWQKINLETALPSAPLDLPKDIYIKINRLYDQEGPINLYARILVEYTCSISVIPISTPFNNNMLSGAIAAGGESSWLATTWTPGLARRFSSWGLPNLTSPPLQGSAYQEIYQAATIAGGARSNLKRIRGDDDKDREKRIKIDGTDCGSSITE
uniref:Nonstructural protein n=1 Tax=Parvoviridae sp. TaxID=1940570 RepID=A0A7D3QPR2_9VIRU|nr:MAG: nonstructural protein [Parvoviridae sp.]